MRSFRCFNLMILLVLLIPIAISSQEGTRPALVSTVMIGPESHGESELEKVIKSSILTQLELDDFVLGELHTSDYMIRASYEMIGANLSVSFEVIQIRADRGGTITEAKWEGPLSLRLDTEIQNAVHTLITRKMKKTIQTEEKILKNKWNLGLNFSRFVPILESNRIAKLGFGGHVSFGYMVFLEKFLLNPSIKVGLIWISTPSICVDDSSCSNITMVPLAAEIKLAYTLSRKFHPYLASGVGGAWLFKYSYSHKEDRAGIVPYVDATLGVDIRLADALGVFVETELHNAFEKIGVIVPNTSHITGIALNIGTEFRY